jgi:hypothetical protein
MPKCKHCGSNIKNSHFDFGGWYHNDSVHIDHEPEPEDGFLLVWGTYHYNSETDMRDFEGRYPVYGIRL